MSVVKRGARVGVAAFALGVSLAGPQAAGVAAADSVDSDAASVSAPSAQTSPSTPVRRARAPRSGQAADPGAVSPRRGRGGPQPAAAAAAPESSVAQTPLPTVNSSTVATRPRTGLRFAPTPRPDLAPTLTAFGVGPVRPGVPVPAAATVAAATPVPRPAASTQPPVVAKATAMFGHAVTTFFDSAANWLSGLHRNALTEFFEGALLMVRRTFFTAFPKLNVTDPTGQAAPDPAYFTDRQLRAYLLDLAKQQYSDRFGQIVPVYGYGPYLDYLKTDSTGAQSDTNTGVVGVDEADFVENDGQYLYVAHGGQLTIVRGEDMSVASRSSLSGDVLGEYLSGDRLSIVSQSGGWYGPQVRLAYGPWQPVKPQTTVTVYDVTDRSAPAVVTQTTFDGSYQSSRAVDGTVYLVVQQWLTPPAPSYVDVPVVGDPAGYESVGYVSDQPAGALIKRPYPGGGPIAYRTYETWDAYVARVGPNIVGLSLPHAYNVHSDGATVDLGPIAAASDILRPQAAGQDALISVVSVDAAHQARPVDSAAVLVSGWAGAVYLNNASLYIGSNQGSATDSGTSTATRIDRFSVSGTKVGWQASGVVPGTLINQFALDEKDGYLRVATHTRSSQVIDGVWTNRDENGIYVLGTAGTVLDQIGKVTGLAPGEQLYAVRFVGDTAYLVTFVRTDPLFAVDLSKPSAPVVTGELVVPGFSNYLQSVGDGLLLGIGQERETGNWNNHLQATLFDVADGGNLTAVDREYLDSGYQWSWSEAQFDHHALLYTPSDGLLVVPVEASGSDPRTGYRYDQYLKVLRVRPTGLDAVGELHPGEPVVRTVRNGDVIYAVGDTSVTAYRLSDLTEIGRSVTSPQAV